MPQACTAPGLCAIGRPYHVLAVHYSSIVTNASELQQILSRSELQLRNNIGIGPSDVVSSRACESCKLSHHGRISITEPKIELLARMTASKNCSPLIELKCEIWWPLGPVFVTKWIATAFKFPFKLSTRV